MDTTRTIPAARPASDVSAAVGFVGLATLAAWVMVCRNWPAIAPHFGFDPALGRLDGPYAALLGVVFSGLAMSVWSVVVEKVHRNASTGMAWDNPRPLHAVLDVSVVKLAGLWTTFALIAAFYCLGRWYWNGSYQFSMHVLGYAAIPLVLLSVPYVLWIDRRMVEPRDASWHFGAMLLGRDGWEMAAVKKHGRAWFIKAFFTAFMLSIIPGGFSYLVMADIGAVAGNPVALGEVLFAALFLVDVQIGTVGYLLTFRPLDSHIRSGNPLLAGWIAALICYPPLVWGIMGGPGIFTNGEGGLLGYEVGTGGWAHWLGGSELLLWVWMGWLVFLTAVYAWATFAFGIRFSNLTYRGVVTNGPYAFTRHPAYVSKNLFWWSSVLPFAVVNGSTTDMVRNTVFLGVVSAIYYWRARTEEAHLLAEDPKYREYYDWMGEHGALTARLRKLVRFANPRKSGPPVMHPAE